MADAGTTKADEADRLEAALERIARNGVRHAGGQADASSDLLLRLDSLIAELRAVLGRDSAD